MAIRLKTSRVRRGRPVHLRSIELDHVGPLDRLRVSLPRPPSPDAGQWIVIVGDEGVGKTTLLRAVAIALQCSAAPIDVVHRRADRAAIDLSAIGLCACAPRVVVIDELDLHLHPRSQLAIIPRLRAAFPTTTFVVSTYSALVLQGARPGEVFILARDHHGAARLTRHDVAPGLDAERLLTGAWFGLASTLDADTRTRLDRYRALLWADCPAADPERRALEHVLRRRLGVSEVTRRLATG